MGEAEQDSIIEEIKGLRKDMQAAFHGDGQNPGIFIRLDRIEQQNIKGVMDRIDKHEDADDNRFTEIGQKFVDVGGHLSAIKLEQSTTKSYVKGMAKVLGGIVTLVGLGLAALQLFVK